MYSKFKIRSIASSLMMAASAAFLMGSCTVYKYADPAQEDGIYSTQERNRGYYRGNAENYPQTNNYYKQYFQSKKGSYDALLVEDEEQSVLFTDVDAYHTKDYIGDDGYVYTEDVSYAEGPYAGWGNNPTSVTINMYNSGYNYGYGSYYSPWGYNTFYGNWGYPYYRYGYRPFSFGIGFSFGYGWGGSYWGGGYGGYYNPYYSHHYYPSYPNYNNVSYNRGRRNSDYSGRGNYSNQTNVNRGRNSSSTTTGRSSSNYSSTNAGRGNSNTSSRESGVINSNDRRASSAINRGDRSSNTTTYDRGNNTTQTARRASFPGSNNTPNRVQQQQNTTRRQPMNTNTRPVQTRQNPSYNNTQNRNTNMRPSTPTRSPSMQSSPSRGASSAPSRSSGSSSGSRGRR